MPDALVNITLGMPSVEEINASYHWTKDKLEADEQVDFNQAYWRRTIAERVKQEFDNYLLRNAEDGFRSHLGWSVIGHSCLRYLWYHFRWFKQENHSARMLEIFAEGHREEAKIRELMKACGAQFLDKVDETGEQVTVSDLNGHFGGSTDGVFIWPAMGINKPCILECKTSKATTDFNKLIDNKDTISTINQRHYVQANGYATSLGVELIMYVCRNKNDSRLYIELFEVESNVCAENRNKAWHVITTKLPPARISKKRNYWVCNMCMLQAVCHDHEAVVPNCRNCQHSTPIENGQWHCAVHGAVIPKEFWIKGCNQHKTLEY